VIPQEFYESELIAPLLEVLCESEFRKTIQTMPGYDVEPMGRLIARIEAQEN
jgi:hypothetical protein